MTSNYLKAFTDLSRRRVREKVELRHRTWRLNELRAPTIRALPPIATWPIRSSSSRAGCSSRRAAWSFGASSRTAAIACSRCSSARLRVGLWSRCCATLPPDTPVFVCRSGDFLGITGYDLHRGCLALVERPPALPIATLLENARLLVVVERVTNAGQRRRCVSQRRGIRRPASCSARRHAIRCTGRRFARPWPPCCTCRSLVPASGQACCRRSVPPALRLSALTPREPSETLEAFAVTATA